MQATLTPVHERQDVPRRRLAPLPQSRPDVSKVAVLLNKNARQVTDALARDLESVVGKENLFYSRSLEEAESFAREIVQRGYGTVVCGGGDGTLARSVNLVQRYVDEANAWRHQRYRRFGEWQHLIASPRFGFLRLGTGNGIAPVVGARDPLGDLKRIVADSTARNKRISLLDIDGEKCFFAGMGYDSLILNDYNWLKARTKGPLGRHLMHSMLGYFAAALTRTLPSVVLNNAQLEARIINRGRAYYIDPRRGDAVEEIEAGATLYEGKAAFIGAGTTPFFGYGFRMFPFAGMMNGMMNLRIGKVGAFETLAHLPGLWRGTYRNASTVFDFFANDVEIELASPYPFQHSGDAQGMRTKLRWRIAEEPLDLVDLHEPRRIFD